MNTFEITVFGKIGGILSKRLGLGKDGKLIKDGSACKMSNGLAMRVPLADVHDFADLISGLEPSQALALGVVREGFTGHINVVVEQKLNGQANTIARTKDFLVFRPKRPALALLDYDSAGASEKIKKSVRENGFWEVLCRVLPALKGTGRVVRYSTSSGLVNGDTGKPIAGSDGVHIFPTIADGSDCERFLETLHDRCWLDGLGWIRIGIAGQLLERSIIDVSVGRPERLVFEGPPQLVKPLKQDASARKSVAVEGKLLDTKKDVPSLTKEEQQKVDGLKATERKRLEPEAKKTREAWAAKRAPAMAKRTAKSVKECKQILLQQTEGVLLPDVELAFVNKDLKGATVGDVLADPERFDGETLADPLEGTSYGTTTAKVYVNVRTDEPWIKSFAHGGLRYTLQQNEETADERRAEQIAENAKIGDDIKEEPILPTVMTLKEMHERLIYVGSSGVIVDRVTGRIRKKDVAHSEYAASMHCIDKKKGKFVPALKLWLVSAKRVQVDVLAWVPGAEQICRPPETSEGARTAFNTWTGLSAPKAPKDWKRQAKPFLDHVEFLVPVKSERERFLQWLAHIIQHPEVLPHTCYLMTVSKTGVGRNLFASIITRVLSGYVAAGVSLPEILDGGFTGRLSRKLLAIVDEAREGSGDKRFQRAERLKSLITEERRHINIKYGTQSVEKNCCRWLMFSNHPDAIPFDNSDRRVVVIENPSERKPTEYYERLFKLLDDKQFIASVWRLLEQWDISKFRPGEHAPMNTAKAKALEFMMTDVECVVRDFGEDCKTPLTSREDIRTFVDDQIKKSVNETHLTHAIAACEMINTGRRVRDAAGKRHSVVIVRAGEDWDRETVRGALTDDVLAAMGKENEFEREVRLFKNKEMKSRKLVSRETIRSHVSAKLGKEVPEKQLTAAIAASNMVATPRRVQFKEKKYTVVIVRQNDELWTPEKVLVAAAAELLNELGLETKGK